MSRWLHEDDEPRRAGRQTQPELVVHYWDGSAPGAREIRDISEHGAYILTAEHWYPGTLIRVILQGAKAFEDGSTVPEPSICVPCRVVRQGEDGVAVEFVFRSKAERNNIRAFLAAMPLQQRETPPRKVSSQRNGQALVEFSLITPMALLLAVNAVNFGGFIFAWITVTNAARAGAQYMIMSSASPGGPTPATSSQVTTLITNDITSLLNRSSLVVATCRNGTTSANGCTTFTDPEAPSYTLATVDVTYTYNPFIPLFSFPKLGISATLPTTSIHRKAVMRMLQ
jgi:Flp pilus assembly protein TadG